MPHATSLIGDVGIDLRERPDPGGRNDWLFVAPKDSKGWILDAICREIGGRQPGSWDVAYNPKTLPDAGTYFFAHYWNYLDHLKRNPHIQQRRTLVWYTHPREIPYSIEEQLEGYSKATKIVFTCSEYLNDWIDKGLDPARAVVVLGGADPHLFRGHVRGAGCVGLSSSFYERKNPEALLDVVRAMPDRRFVLVGRNWEQFARFGELSACANFEYLTASYAEYPAIYAQFDVFLSLAMLEGGPIPVLEAMTENVVPVASRTGFCPDLIRHGENGFLFDVGAPASTIAPLIEAAFALRGDIRASVSNYSWDAFARAIHQLDESPVPSPANGLVTAAPAPPVAEPTARRASEGSRWGSFPPRKLRLAERISARSTDAWLRMNGMKTLAGDMADAACRTAALRASLSRSTGPSARDLVIVLHCETPMDLLATTALDDLIENQAWRPFVVVATPSIECLGVLRAWAIQTGLDGLFEFREESVEQIVSRVASSAAIVVVETGAQASSVRGAAASLDSQPSGEDQRTFAAIDEARRVRFAPALISSAEGDPAVEVAVTGAEVVARPDGAGFVLANAEGAAVMRAAPLLRGDGALQAPLAIVRNQPYAVRVLASGGGAASVSLRLPTDELKAHMVTAFLNRGGAGNPVVRAFADGLGCALRYADESEWDAPGAVAVWGVLRGSDEVVRRARAMDRPFFYIDHAYVGRGHYLNYRITRNAYEAGPVRDWPADRVKKFGIELSPWRRGGGSVIVCPPTQYFMDAHGCPNWLEDTLEALRRATDRPVEIRAKPATGEPSEPLSNVFARAHAIVCHSSNIAVEAVIAGVPAFVAPTSAAAPVAETDLSLIEVPRRPDREAWIRHIASSQFTLAEIASGEAWALLMETERRELVS